MSENNDSNNKIIRDFNDKVNKKNHETYFDDMSARDKEADKTEASDIKAYTAKIKFAKRLKNADKMTDKQYRQARIGLKGELSTDLAQVDGMRQPDADASDLNEFLNQEMDWLHAAAGSEDGNHMSHVVDKYYSKYKSQHPQKDMNNQKETSHQEKSSNPKHKTNVVHHIQVTPVTRNNQNNSNDNHNKEDDKMNNSYNTTNNMDQKQHDQRVKQAFIRLYKNDNDFHNQVNMHMESSKNRQLRPVITPHLDNDMVRLHDGSMATRQTTRIYKDYSNQVALADYRAALSNYLYTKNIGVGITHNPGETDTDPNPHERMNQTDVDIINKEAQDTNPQHSAEAHHNYDDEFYVNSARVDPFWTRKTHNPYVKMDTVHRTDINPGSPLAGHHVTTYIDRNGNMHHSQIIPGGVFNNILRANGRQPYTMGDFMHSIGHRIASRAMGLVFRAKTFVSRGLRKVRGKFSHFINVASVKASRFKLNVQREINMERHLRHERLLAQKAKIVNRCKHPYDAFNFMSPREMREAFGDNPKNYHWKQDFHQTRKRNSIFNRVTPEYLDKTQGPSWRPGYNTNSFNRTRTNQRAGGFEI